MTTKYTVRRIKIGGESGLEGTGESIRLFSGEICGTVKHRTVVTVKNLFSNLADGKVGGKKLKYANIYILHGRFAPNFEGKFVI